MSITWNGVSSDTIGVIVERIPNRYVPTRRFSPQQVAGRNGNILLVDKSFPNVEQEYEVYLSAEAQGLPSVARACAEWLMGPDGYCRLQDSYDTTVYREAFLMGGYDLENILNKFGRCTITFSCKPQKYLLTGDTPIEIPAGITTYTGDVVQFDGVTGASITSLSTTITPTQSLHGYSSPWPAGGGKNLIDFDETVGTANIDTPSCLLQPGTYYCYVAAASASFNSPIQISSNDSGFAVITTDSSAEYAYASHSLGSYSRKKAVITVVSAVYVRIHLQVNGNVKNNRIACMITADGNGYNDVPDSLTLSNEAFLSIYSPYSNICPISGRTGLSVYVSPTTAQADATTYAVDWTTEAGTVYGGTLDVVTGVLTVDRAMVDLGDFTWELWPGYSSVFRTAIPSGCKLVTNNTVPDWLSSIYKVVKGTDIATNNATIGMLHQTYLTAHNDSCTDAATFKTAMNGVQLCYELATPLTYQLTPQEIEVLVGKNNVWTSSGPVSVTVEAPFVGTVTNPTPFEARPMLEVSGVGEITINGKSIQILESVSDFQIDCEAMEADGNSKIYCMDFPELSGGENEIAGDGSITALTVTPRWWTL